MLTSALEHETVLLTVTEFPDPKSWFGEDLRQIYGPRGWTVATVTACGENNSFLAVTLTRPRVTRGALYQHLRRLHTAVREVIGKQRGFDEVARAAFAERAGKLQVALEEETLPDGVESKLIELTDDLERQFVRCGAIAEIDLLRAS